MKKLTFVLSVPGEAMYLGAQIAAAKATSERLGVELKVVSAEMESVVQSQQLLNFVQLPSGSRPDGILVEPVSATGLPVVAEAAVAAGIGWVVSNAHVDYLTELRKTAKAPVFLVSQDHVEVGRIQGKQCGAILPDGGTVLYLRGPAMNDVATMRFEGLERGKPKSVRVQSLKIQGSSAENAFKSVCSWMGLSTGRQEVAQLIASQNVDFIVGARKALESNMPDPERSKWLAVPCAGVGIPKATKPLVDQGTLCAAVVTAVTMDTAVEMLVRGLTDGVQPRERTFVDAQSYPSLEELEKKWKRLRS